MKNKKLLACLMAGAMALSMAACGNEDVPASSSAPVSSEESSVVESSTVDEPVTEERGAASLDFEDGNFGFAAVVTVKGDADPSKLSVEDAFGSKALLATNYAGKVGAYVGIDLDAVLGDKVADVACISFYAGVQQAGDFSAVSGALYATSGDNQILGAKGSAWSVYLENKNPKQVVVELPSSFEAGAGNYIIISKETEAGDGKSTLVIDDIAFYDAAGNLIEADSTAVVGADSPLCAVEEASEFVYGTNVLMDSAYAGDWSLTGVIPGGVFAGIEGPAHVTVKYTLVEGLDYYLAKPLTSWWSTFDNAQILDMEEATEGAYYHLQSDGFLVIDDWTNDTISFTLDADAVAKCAEEGGLGFQTYGFIPQSATVSTDTAYTKVDSTYAGDWSLTGVIPACYFENVEDSVSVTVKYTLVEGLDYYLAKPLTSWWSTFDNAQILDMEDATEGAYFHLQGDGFIVIDDWTNDTITFVLDADAAAKCAEEGGLGFQTYGFIPTDAYVSTGVYRSYVEAEYAGDWSLTGVIPAADFAAFAGQDVNVTIEYTLVEGLDYYLAKPLTSWWSTFDNAQLVSLEEATEGAYFHLQSDGFLVIDDWTNNTLSFTLSADAAAKAAEEGGLGFQTYGVIVQKAYVSAKNQSTPMDAAYAGDWSLTGCVPAAFFADATGNVSVTVKYTLVEGPEYYLAKPLTSWWSTFDNSVYQNLEEATEGAYFHLQSDGFLVIDDWTNDTLTFVIDADTAAKLAEEGGLGFQTYGFIPTYVTVQK